MNATARRLLVTLLIPALAYAAQQLLLLPGVDRSQLHLMQTLASRSFDRANVSVLALGLAPALSAFFLVEVVALLVPPWRRLRRGTPAQRCALQRAAIALTFVLAFVQAWFLVRYFTSLSGPVRLFESSTTARLLITISLVAGTGFMIMLASLIDRFGLGQGFSILLVAPIVPQLLELRTTVGERQPRDLLWLAVEVGAIVFAARAILTAHARAATTNRPIIRQPTSSLQPLTASTALLSLGFYVTRYAPLPGATAYYVVQAGSIVAGVVLLSRLFLPPARLAERWQRVVPPESRPLVASELAAALRPALARTLAFLLALAFALPIVADLLRMPFPLDPLLLVTATAVTLDLVAEWRARKAHGELVAVWPLHQVALVDVALAALANAGIPAHARAAHHRALLWFFGPYIPIELLVPREQAPAARDCLTAALLDPA